MKKNKAFTLAEILISMMVIGVISLLTIPGMMSNSQNKRVYTSLAKAQMTVANATGAAEAQYGSIRFWDWSEIIPKHYIKSMNAFKSCEGPEKCLPEKYIKESPMKHWWRTGWKTFITTDGMYWAATGSSGCTLKEGDPLYIKNGCAYFEVDINGQEKPNKNGRDIFGFVITPEGTFPFGTCPGCSTAHCKDKIGGSWACTGRVLKEGKLSW